MPARFHLRIPDPDALSAAGPFGFRSRGAEGLSEELQAALREDGLFRRWCATLDDPDAVDAALGAVDPAATVRGEQADLHIDLVATTALSGSVLRHRLGLLAGRAWQLFDVTAA